MGAAAAGGGGYVINNAVWFDTNDYLSKTFSGAATSSTRKIYNIWVKIGDIGVDPMLISAGNVSPRIQFYVNSSGKLVWYEQGADTATKCHYVSTAVFRDVTGWQCFTASIDTGDATAADRLKLYHNGVEITAFDTQTTYGSSYATIASDNSNPQYVSRTSNATSANWIGYMAQHTHLDGQSIQNGDIAITDLVGVDDNGAPIPVDVSALTFGNNGYLQDYAVAPGTGNGAGTDVSGNTNHFTDVSMTSAQQVTDSPTDDADNDVGNYTTFNSLQPSATGLSGGNKQFDTSATSTHNTASTTTGHSSGKWYFEITANAALGSNARVGIIPQNNDNYTGADGHVGDDADSYAYSDTGNKENNNSATAYGNSYANGNRINVAVDLDNGTIWFGKDGTWQNSATQGEIEAGTTTNAAYTFTVADVYFAACSQYNAGGFALNTGEGGFTDTVPAGFLPWGFTADLPAPTVTDPSAEFQVSLTTHGGTSETVTAPSSLTTDDWLVISKNRDTSEKWYWSNGLSGYTKYLSSDATTAETTDANVHSASGTTLTLGSTFAADDYVTYLLKAGTAGGASNSDGTVTSTVSAASHGGFAIIKHTNTSGDYTYGHGLAGVDLLMQKGAGSQGWLVWSAPLGVDGYLALHSNDAVANPAGDPWSDTIPSSTVITTAGTTWYGGGSIDITTFAFKKTPGLVGIGSYTGNGNADGPMVIVDDGASGFTPLVMITKNISNAAGWAVHTTAFGGPNPNYHEMYLNATDDQGTSGLRKDFLANGAKMRHGSSTAHNTSGDTYIYLAFAEFPFGGDGVAQARAR
jgi:hypothetical protein